MIAELDELVDGIAAILHERGHIADTHADKGFTTRLAALNRDFPGAGVLANLRGKFGPALAELWRSHQLLDIVEQLIGRDIDGHANWVLRSKTPETSRLTVPWHQDAAYFTPDAEATFIPTIWIPLVDATRENGALQFLRGAHNPPRIYHHDIESQTTANRDSWYLIMAGADVAAEEIVTCEAPLGSVILHSNLIPHRSTENHTDAVRWAVDLRWHAPGTPPGINIPSVPMRRVDEPGLKPDFKVWGRGVRGEMARAQQPRRLRGARAHGRRYLARALGGRAEGGPALHGPRRAARRARRRIRLTAARAAAVPQAARGKAAAEAPADELDNTLQLGRPRHRARPVEADQRYLRAVRAGE